MSILLLLLHSFMAAADQTIDCDYSMYGAPFTSISLSQGDDGRFAPMATITPQGMSPHQEPFSVVATMPGELLHGWISGGTENSLELIIFAGAPAAKNSKLVNPHIPIGKEMWGSCSPLPSGT